MTGVTPVLNDVFAGIRMKASEVQELVDEVDFDGTGTLQGRGVTDVVQLRQPQPDCRWATTMPRLQSLSKIVLMPVWSGELELDEFLSIMTTTMQRVAEEGQSKHGNGNQVRFAQVASL